jgi:hypothetical protein
MLAAAEKNDECLGEALIDALPNGIEFWRTSRNLVRHLVRGKRARCFRPSDKWQEKEDGINPGGRNVVGTLDHERIIRIGHALKLTVVTLLYCINIQ